MKLSKLAWNRSKTIYEAITKHPFNLEMIKGSLSQDKFSYYIEQDAIYLNDFTRCQSLIATRISPECMSYFLKLANFTNMIELEIVHQFYKKNLKTKETRRLSPATMGFVSYLIRTATTEPVEVAVAAVLPSLWIYREVGLHIAENAEDNNCYQRWIDTYTGEDFKTLVLEAIHIFDELASRTSEYMRQKMLEAFYITSCYEWHFWNDIYHLRTLDEFTNGIVAPHECCNRS